MKVNNNLIHYFIIPHNRGMVVQHISGTGYTNACCSSGLARRPFKLSYYNFLLSRTSSSLLLGFFSRPPPTILVTQTPAAALVEPGDLLNSLTTIFCFLEPLPPSSGDSFHVLHLFSSFSLSYSPI